jgi:hypothetical protein
MEKMLRTYVKKFEKDNQSVTYFEVVQRTFADYPKNVELPNVVLKVAVLNKLYSTNIFDVFSMAKHIYKLGNRKNLDGLLKKGNLNAVNMIRKGHGIRRKNSKNDIDEYSFATKYCHFSNPGQYPVYDSYVEKAIWNLQKNYKSQFKKEKDIFDPQNEDLRIPLDFLNIIKRIKGLSSFSDYEQVDRALWKYGYELKEKERAEKELLKSKK